MAKKELKVKLNTYSKKEKGETIGDTLNKLEKVLDDAGIAYQIYDIEEQETE